MSRHKNHGCEKGDDMNTNRFGMFIHWGLYAMLGMHEQALARFDLDKSEYERLMHTFDPIDYDPEQWVLMAKKAGMSYICFTTKHHDGFCMWNTAQTDYNIMNTPYGKDVLKMLADACKKHGMKLSLYYSNPDWHHEYAYNPASTHQWKAVVRERVDTEKYREYIKAQITELLTGYGEIYTLFWDIPPMIEDPSINALVRRLQPDILINDRGFDTGDFSTPERSVPEGTRFERMTEACESIGAQSWGYRKNEDYHSVRYLTTAIDKIMAMGGSYLLNVGPMPNGEINAESRRVLERVGDWYTRMQGCLEGTTPDQFDYGVQGNLPHIALRKNGKTYLHFYNGLPARAVALAHYARTPRAVRLMNSHTALPFDEIRLPAYYRDGRALGPFLHIYDIPVDDYASEPIVIEIDFGES